MSSAEPHLRWGARRMAAALWRNRTSLVRRALARLAFPAALLAGWTILASVWLGMLLLLPASTMGSAEYAELLNEGRCELPRGLAPVARISVGPERADGTRQANPVFRSGEISTASEAGSLPGETARERADARILERLGRIERALGVAPPDEPANEPPRWRRFEVSAAEGLRFLLSDFVQAGKSGDSAESHYGSQLVEAAFVAGWLFAALGAGALAIAVSFLVELIGNSIQRIRIEGAEHADEERVLSERSTIDRATPSGRPSRKGAGSL